MLKRFFNFLFGKKEVPTVSVELNALEVSEPETFKKIEDVYFPVTALADAPGTIVLDKPKKARKQRKPKTVTTSPIAAVGEITEVKPKKRRYYKPRKKKTDTSSASSHEKSL